MTTFTPYVAGSILTAALLNKLVPLYAIKTANQVVTNSTVLVNDSDITFTLLPNQAYSVELNAQVVSSATSHGVQIAWATTGTVGISARSGVGPVSATGVVNTRATSINSVSFTSTAALTYMTDTQTSQVWERLIFTGGASGGTVTLQFAQAAAGAATTTTMGSGTHAIARVVGS